MCWPWICCSTCLSTFYFLIVTDQIVFKEVILNYLQLTFTFEAIIKGTIRTVVIKCNHFCRGIKRHAHSYICNHLFCGI